MGEHMTKENYKKMQAKLEELKKRRAVISKSIGEAREHGDLKENSAYHAAKEEQGLNEMRIRDLEERVASAVVVKESQMGEKDSVALNSTVKLVELGTENESVYTIVSEMEADPLEGKISTESPKGSALLGQKLGAVVEVEAPRGIIKFRILEIK